MSEDKSAAAVKRAGMVDALLHEREGYVKRNLPDRVAQVDEQIRLLGGQPPASRRTRRDETA